MNNEIRQKVLPGLDSNLYIYIIILAFYEQWNKAKSFTGPGLELIYIYIYIFVNIEQNEKSIFCVHACDKKRLVR